MIFSAMSKIQIIITFVIFSVAAALPDNYYGAPTIAPAPQPPTVAPAPQPPTIDPAPQPPTVDPPPQPTTTTTAAPPPEPTTSEPTSEDLIQVLAKKGNFKQLIKAITELKLTDILDSIDAQTIFAPNDAAFDKVADTDFEKLTDPEKITIINR